MKPELRMKLIREYQNIKIQQKGEDLSSSGYKSAIIGFLFLLLLLPYSIYSLMYALTNVHPFFWSIPLFLAISITVLLIIIIKYHVNKKIILLYEIMASDDN